MTEKKLKHSWYIFKNRGFSDYLYFLNLALSWLFIITCILITIFSGRLGITDLSLVSVGIPAVFTELGIHTGFIVWKAKTENISKYGVDPDGVGIQTSAIGFQPPADERTDEED